jgi:cytochrome oxidase Cu insertion factor (SCO1/SenC/PrrC family)
VKRSLPFLIVLVLMIAPARSAVVEVEPQRGRAVAQINWTDETNRTHNLSEFSGYPLIVLPIYTRCRGACVQNVAQLKKALASSSADPRQFRVLLFSFDAADSPAILANDREREAIPLSGSVGSASQTNIDAFLESLAFPVGKAGSEFTHPNSLFFLDANLHLAQWIYGTGYSSRDVDAALRVASGDSSWLAQHSEVLYALLLFSGSILCVALCVSLIQLRARRQFTIAQPASR